MKLTIILDVKNKIEAYEIVTKLSFKHKVLSAVFNRKTYTFDDKDETKKVVKFLREDFGKKTNQKL